MFDVRVRRAALDLLLPGLGDLGARWDLAARGLSPDADDLLALIAPAIEMEVSA